MSIYVAPFTDLTKEINRAKRTVRKQATGNIIVEFIPKRDEVKIVTSGQTASLIIKLYYIIGTKEENRLETFTISYEWSKPNETF